MALYRIDGWDDLPSGTTASNAYLAADGWFNANQMQSQGGRFGKGQCLQFYTSVYGVSASQAIGKRFTTETCVVGQAFNFNSSGSGAAVQFAARDDQGGGSVQWTLHFTLNGVIELWRGPSNTNQGGTLIAVTPANTYHVNQWDFIEVKHKIHSSTGIVEVRVNTVVVMSYSGNTQNGTPLLGIAPGWDVLVYTLENFGSSGFSIDDRYILDDTGTINNTYLGNVRVNTQFVQAPGDLTQFSVTGAATNWQAVLAGTIDDSKYVSAPTSGNTDLYTANPNVTAQAVFGVQARGLYRQDDSTQMITANLVKVGGVIYAGTNKYLSGTYTYYRDLWELNPNTGVAWTATILNATQVGTKVV